LEISETKELFIDNAIGGSELLDLSDADLRSMGIAKVGHRKKILSKVAEMKGIKLADSSKTSMTTSMSDDTSLDIGTRNKTPYVVTLRRFADVCDRSNPRQVLPQRRSAHNEDPNERAV
jgi:hypothetical protein